MHQAALRVYLEKWGIKVDPSTRKVTFTHGIKVENGEIDIGDDGGFTGFKFDDTGTSIQVEIDGTLTHSFETDGTLTDEVA